ncbi:hypothetical protein CHELA1G11_20822 [Hyphomicrobiales bacterium]|nr:hypothetical protein CHELA1G11_20822 [Hyphomicrobiales bacterium]CAH1692113.1 hypothetical protein CHELA1G2_21138 [Hyphomicrobiales bacterium]
MGLGKHRTRQTGIAKRLPAFGGIGLLPILFPPIVQAECLAHPAGRLHDHFLFVAESKIHLYSILLGAAGRTQEPDWLLDHSHEMRKEAGCVSPIDHAVIAGECQAELPA